MRTFARARAARMSTRPRSRRASASTSTTPPSTPRRRRSARLIDLAWDGYDGTARRRARARRAPAMPIPTTICRWIGSRRATRSRPRSGASAIPPRRPRILAICGSPRSDETCPGEMSKTFRLVQLARDGRGSRGLRVRPARPQPPHLRIRPRDLSLQGLRFHRHAALPLAVLLLSQSRDRPGQ